MTNQELFIAIDELCDAKDVDKEVVYQALEKSIANAYKKEMGVPNCKLTFNEEKHEVLLFEYYEVVTEDELDEEDPSKITLAKAKELKKSAKLGDKFEIKKPISTKDFGRIAISSAKQVFSQSLKTSERERALKYFQGQIDEMLIGVLVKYDSEKAIFDMGYDTTATVNVNELTKEDLKVGAKVRLYLSKVEETNKGPKIYVSRSDKNLIKRLFENSIPEIKDGSIEIYAIARDAGDRSKICVKRVDENIDPLGACLGPKGRRIKDINDALGGEKIDLYEYSDDPDTLIRNALAPAEVFNVIYDEESKSASVVVPDDNLSLAIGKKGQNVRLAVQSCGWKIDIKSVTQAKEEGIEF